MEIIDNQKYISIIEKCLNSFPQWEALDGKTIFLSGATGMIGSLLVDIIMLRNETLESEKQCRILAVGRNQTYARKRFGKWFDKETFCFLTHDVSKPIQQLPWEVDYFIHAASTTHPVAYATEPVNTILSNVLGTYNLLEIARKNANSKFLLLSSVEIYGENRGDAEYFTEDYCGFIDCNTLRAGYPEGKRASESLCQAYISQYGVDAKIVRLPRCYGPTMRVSDTKALSQFIKKGVSGEDIVLKSAGNQLYSYTHVADAVRAILFVLIFGERGQAYNVGDINSDITLKDLAKTISDYVGTRVIFEIPSEIERQGYSTATKALLNSEKIRTLGWTPIYSIVTGLHETIDILHELNQSGGSI